MNIMTILTAPNIGAGSMGFVMGILVWYFVGKFKSFNPKILGSTASVLSGGTVVKIFGWNGRSDDAIWYYPMGLVIGTLVYWLIINAGKDAEKFFGPE